jgi:hypothetical protein
MYDRKRNLRENESIFSFSFLLGFYLHRSLMINLKNPHSFITVNTEGDAWSGKGR